MSAQSPSAPLFSALRELVRQDARRFHLPGHKGKASFDGIFEIDFTEIPATGNLYGECGAIQLAEAEVARYYGAQRCFFLTCGATQGVKSALAAYCGAGTTVVLDRNCHQSAMDACAALDLRPEFVYPELMSSGITGDICAAALANALDASGARAALVTSPTYYGFCLDIKSLARAAHSRGAALIVDSAHGSHLRACGLDDPLALGADTVIFSAHKTLSALGQGAMLLTQSGDADFCARLRGFTAFFGTSSPSYPIMASLDLARFELESCPLAYPAAAVRCARVAEQIKSGSPFAVLSPAPSYDPCRLTVYTASSGVSGFDAAKMLRTRAIEPEMADSGNVVLIFTPQDDDSDTDAVCSAFLEIGKSAAPCAPAAPLPLPRPKRVLTPRQARFSETELVPLAFSSGRTAAQNLSPYPPGVPVVAIGEQIDDFAVEYLIEKGYNGLNGVWVVRHCATSASE